MALDPDVEERVRAAAEDRGHDPDEAVAQAEKRAAAKPDAAKPNPDKADAKAETGGKPIADRLLIGFLPFIKVRELRAGWLGLAERIADDEMTCGEYAAKHGGGAAAAPATPGGE